jgi:hypothetical protein
MGYFDFMTDITGGVTNQIGVVGKQTGFSSVFSDVGYGMLDVFHSGVGFLKKVTDGLGNWLSGDTLNLLLMVAVGGVAIYGISTLTSSNSNYRPY